MEYTNKSLENKDSNNKLESDFLYQITKKMRKKPLALRIFIRICVVFMVVSLVGAYVVYMFTPATEQPVESITQDSESGDNVDIIIPEIDPEDPESSASPIVITHDEEEQETQVID